MKRLTLLCALLVLLGITAAAAEPLRLDDDLAHTVTIPYDESDPAAGSYSYSYCFPHADESDPRAVQVNTLFEQKAELLEYGLIPMIAGGYMDDRIPFQLEMTYRITGSNDQYFSVLFIRRMVIDGSEEISWEGSTFDLLNGEIDSTFDLPRLLGILKTGAQSEFMENRQVEKASQAVRTLILDMIDENPDDIPYDDREFTDDYLKDMLFPEEDFYLDETGNPVFYVEPGILADESLGYLTFSIPLQDIRDEM